MGYKCSFMDNQVYSAEDVNRVFSKLITSGAVLFNDTGSTISDLNTAVSEFTSGGVTLNADCCRVICEDGTYKISEGACFMDDGSMIEFTEGGENIDISTGSIQYVYLKRNRNGNTIEIVISAEEAGADCVPLARIDEKGNIFDTRRFASSKANASGQNISATMEFSGSIEKNKSVTLDMGFAGFKYLLYVNLDYKMYSGFINLESGESITAQLGSTGYTFEFRKIGSKLQITALSGTGNYHLSLEVR